LQEGLDKKKRFSNFFIVLKGGMTETGMTTLELFATVCAVSFMCFVVGLWLNREEV